MHTYEAKSTDLITENEAPVRGAWMPLEKASLYAPASGGEFVDVEIFSQGEWRGTSKGRETEWAKHALEMEMAD